MVQTGAQARADLASSKARSALTVSIPSRAALRADLRFVQEPDRELAPEVEYFDGVEFFKGDVWLSGRVARGHFQRLSDVLNHTSTGLLVHGAIVGGLPGLSGPDGGRDTWIDLRDIDLVGHTALRREPSPDDGSVSEHVSKKPQRLTVWTASHEIRGTVHLYLEADLETFLRSEDPPLIAMTDAEVSWVTQGRTSRQFPFVLLNRRRVFATRAD